MLGAMPRLFWNWSNWVRPWKASRRIRMLHHSPTRSSERAMGHCMVPKLLRCMGGRPRSGLRDASYYGGVATIMQVTKSEGPRWAGSGVGMHRRIDGKRAGGGAQGARSPGGSWPGSTRPSAHDNRALSAALLPDPGCVDGRVEPGHDPTGIGVRSTARTYD